VLVANLEFVDMQQIDHNHEQTPSYRVLIIEDDQTLSTTLRYVIQKHGHLVTVATDGMDGIKQARSFRPDIVLLDLMLPGVDGRDICRYLRRWSDVPILMLTALGDEQDIIAGLNAGADDYVTKPFRMNELLARLNALTRRKRRDGNEEATLISGDLIVSLSEHRATFAGRELRLAPKEFQVLTALMRRAGNVCTRSELRKESWGEGVVVDPRNVDVHIRLIRAQLEGEPDGSSLIQTVHGIGYRFDGELGPNEPAPEIYPEGIVRS
jgi:DNA-binding response OmpR family regulator